MHGSARGAHPISVSAALYPRGKVGGLYPALPTRADEAYVDFIADARNFLLHAQQRPIAAYGRELVSRAGLPASPDPANTRRAAQTLMADPALRIYFRVKRSLQEAFGNRLLAAFGGRRERLMAALDEADGRGPGSVEYDLDAPVPEYARTQIHPQPGGYTGEPLAGVLYDFGLKVFMVLAMLLFHEIPAPVARRVIGEALRVLRPDGAFTILDFGGDRSSDVYSMFFAEMDAANNGEPYLTEYRRSNIEDLVQEAGFELRPYDPSDPGAGLRSGRVGVKP